MDKLEKVREEVKALHEKSTVESMRTWFYDNHILVVAKYAREISLKAGANPETAVLASLLHDIARTQNVMDEPDLMNESLKMSEEILKRNGYPGKVFENVRQAILFHGCHAQLPQTEEGKVMATADALAHLMTDFYPVMMFNRWVGRIPNDFEAYRNWTLSKAKRDFEKKIFYGEYRKLAEKRYESLKLLFSNWRKD